MKGWKTIGFNLATVFFGGLETSGLVDAVPPQYTGILVAGLGIVNMILRAFTNTAIGKKE